MQIKMRRHIEIIFQVRKQKKIEKWNFYLFFGWVYFFFLFVGAEDREYRWKDKKKVPCKKKWKKILRKKLKKN